MSHFCVSVFSDGNKTIEELLAPYQENNMGTCPKKYMKFFSTTKNNKEEYETKTVKRVCLKDGTYLNPYDINELKKWFSYSEFIDGKDHSDLFGDKKGYLITNDWKNQIVFYLFKEGAELKEVPLKEIYPTLKDYIEKYVGDTWDEEQQDYGYWENPNAKWDWYQIGGRFKGLLKAKSGEKGESSRVYPVFDEYGKYSQAKVKDINFETDTESYKKALRWWEVLVEGQPLMENEKESDFFNLYKIEYLKEKYKTKENYAKCQSVFSTFAVITPDGKWYAKGEMGWWAVVSNEDFDWDLKFKERFIDTANPDWVLTVVDCHI